MEVLDLHLKSIEKETIFGPWDVLQSMSSSPFSKMISNIELSTRFLLPKFKLYNKMINLTKHVLHYKKLMEIMVMSNSKKDVVMCKALRLVYSGLPWYGSIGSLHIL